MESPSFLRNLARSKVRARFTRQSLKGLLTHNLALKLVAIVLAIVMWTFVASQRRGETTELKFSSPLVFRNIPPNVEVAQAPVQAVSVLVRAPRRQSASLNPNQFQVFIDLANQFPGEIEYDLSARNVSYLNVAPPEDMTVLQISPSRIPLRLEETLQKELAVRPRFSGSPAPGFTIVQTRIVPQMAEVIGPRSVVEQVHALYTRPLDVQDLHSNVELLVNLDLPQGVRVAGKQEPFFRAVIQVTGNPTRVLLREIPVIFENVEHTYKVSTTALNVHLEGSRDALAGLSRKNVFAVIDLAKYPPGDYRGVVPRVVLPENVRVLEQWPIVDLYVFKRPAE
jgi:YbbR domain-containing protein